MYNIKIAIVVRLKWLNYQVIDKISTTLNQNFDIFSDFYNVCPIFWGTDQMLFLYFFCILPIIILILGIFSEKQIFAKLFL